MLSPVWQDIPTSSPEKDKTEVEGQGERNRILSNLLQWVICALFCIIILQYSLKQRARTQELLYQSRAVLIGQLFNLVSCLHQCLVFQRNKNAVISNWDGDRQA